VTLCDPQGAFYLFPNFSAYFGRSRGEKPISGSADLAAFILEEARVALIPGSAFGADSNLRLSFALSRERIETGIERISTALASLT
jgi:aspartate aminotransferase